MIEPKRASEMNGKLRPCDHPDKMGEEFLEEARANHHSGFYERDGMSEHVRLRLLQHIAYLTEQVREGRRLAQDSIPNEHHFSSPEAINAWSSRAVKFLNETEGL